MKKIKINGIEFNNFGSNNYSDGMELITCCEHPKDLVKRVLNGEFYGVYLNPSAECSNFEFFGVFGTEEQYKKFYERQRGAQIAERLVDKFGFDNWPENYKEERAKIEREYKDWWDTLSCQSLAKKYVVSIYTINIQQAVKCSLTVEEMPCALKTWLTKNLIIWR